MLEKMKEYVASEVEDFPESWDADMRNHVAFILQEAYMHAYHTGYSQGLKKDGSVFIAKDVF